MTILVYIIYSLTKDQKTMLKEMGSLVDELSSLVTSELKETDESKISSNVFNGQRLAENASRNNSTNIELSEDGKIGKVTNAKKDGNVIPNKYLITDAKKDGDVSVYDQDGNKIGETLFDDDYLNRNGDEIDFDKTYSIPNLDTKIYEDFNMNNIMGNKGLYGDNAELVVSNILSFEGNKTYVYIDTRGHLTIGIGTFIDNGRNPLMDNSSIFKISLTKNGNVYSGKDLIPIYNKLKNIANGFNGKNLKNINKSLSNTKYEITKESKFNNFIKDIKVSANKELPKKFPNYINYPTNARNALLDMEYNMGSNFIEKPRYNSITKKKSDGWPKLYNAVRNEDWNKAAKQSNRPQLGDFRNNFVKDQFNKAAK